MDTVTRQLIWQGRLHLGDEPGIYGNACYVGLGCDLPITVREFDEHPVGRAAFVLGTENMSTQRGYPSHLMQVVCCEVTDAANHYGEWVLGETPLVPGDTLIEVDLSGVRAKPGAPRYLSARVRLDTSAPPALYDDFVVVELSLQSTRYYASFGFY
jgi:hypothetical protein